MPYIIIIIAIIVIIKYTNKGVKTNVIKLNTPQTLQKNIAEHFPYKSKDVLTKAEYDFYKILKSVCDRYGFLICPKVGLKDIAYVTDRKNYMRWWGKINQKHVDFLICDYNLKPILAIELDDSSHRKEKAIKNDDFKNKLFKTIELPLKRIEVMFFYPETLLDEIMKQYIKIYPNEKAGELNAKS